MVSDLLEIAKLASQSASNQEDIEEIQHNIYKAASIAKKAKKSIYQYPAVYSAGLGDLDTAMRINKFLETQYAIFTLLSCGLNPRSANGNVEAYLSSYSAEGLLPKNIKKGDVFFSSIDAKSKEDIENNWVKIKDDLLTEYKPKSSTGLFSTEADGNDEGIGAQGSTPFTKRTNDELTKKMANASPTIINVGILLGTNAESDKVDVSLAIKCVPNFIENWELMSLFEQAIEDKFKFNRFIKLTTGQIKFFRDFVLGLDKAKRDAELYARLGRHPWYRRLYERKTKRRVKFFGAILAKFDFLNLFKGLVRDTTAFPPIATIVCSEDELTSAAKMKYSFLLKKQQILNNIMGSLSLLCLAVYQPTLEVVNFHLDGFKDPMTVSLKDMRSGGGSDDATKELAQTMKLMMQRGLL